MTAEVSERAEADRKGDWARSRGPRPGSVSLIMLPNSNKVPYALGTMAPPTERQVAEMRRHDRSMGHPDVSLEFTPSTDPPDCGDPEGMMHASRRYVERMRGTVRFSLRIPGTLHASAERLASTRGLSLNTLLLLLLQHEILTKECRRRW